MGLSLTGSEKRALRARGQLLEDALRIGREGATPAVIRELDRMLTARELVKIRFMDTERDERARLADVLAENTNSACAGAVGHTALFFRPRAEPSA